MKFIDIIVCLGYGIIVGKSIGNLLFNPYLTRSEQIKMFLFTLVISVLVCLYFYIKFSWNN